MRRSARGGMTRRYSNKRRRGGLKRAAVKRTKAPVATGYSRKGGLKTQYTMRQVSDTCVRIVGRSYIGVVNNAAIANGNAIGLMFDVNPTLLGDRVAVLASTYDKYCYQTMKFTYVPQCPTSQPGSVMLVFERDPEAQAANTTSGSYMQEVMSYEHAVLTPAWVSTSVTYKRDPHEVKTWFMGGDQANLSARETSQGTFIAYTSNAPPQGQVQTVTFNPSGSTGATATSETVTGTLGGAGGKLGFVVMDFVLDLVSPNILPNKTRTLGQQQYQLVAGLTLANASSTALVSPYYQQQFYPVPSLPFLNPVPAGTIFEVVLDGTGGLSQYLGYFQTGSGVPTGSPLVSGARMYMTAVPTWGNSLTQNTAGQGAGTVYYLTGTLADAIAMSAAGGQVTQGALANPAETYQPFPAALGCTIANWAGSAQLVQQQAYVRVLTTLANSDQA